MIINTNTNKIPTQHLYFTRVGVYNSQTDNFTRLVKYVRLVFFAQTFFYLVQRFQCGISMTYGRLISRLESLKRRIIILWLL